MDALPPCVAVALPPAPPPPPLGVGVGNVPGHVLPNGLIVYANGLIGSVDQTCVGGQIVGQAVQSVVEQMGVPMSAQLSGHLPAQISGQIAQLSGHLPAQISGQIVGQIAGQTAGQMAWQMPGQAPEQTFGARRSPLSVRDGDWTCPGCANHNFAHRAHCNRCQTLRPDFKEGDWVCSGCQNLNFAIREQCNRCKLPRRHSTGVGGGARGSGGDLGVGFSAVNNSPVVALAGLGTVGTMAAPAMEFAGAMVPVGTLGTAIPLGAVAL